MIRLLIHRFLARTGVPMVLNNFLTKTNRSSAPAWQALDCFLRTRIGLQAVRPGVAMESPAARLAQPAHGSERSRSVIPRMP